MSNYHIVRFYLKPNRNNGKIIKTGLSLEEAKAHCSREDTRKAGVWFEGYNKTN